MKLPRRAFLRGVGGVALALPFLDAMRSSTEGQTPRRYVQLYTPLGFSPGQWYEPMGETGFRLLPFASALAPHAEDLLIIRGMRAWSGATGHHQGLGGVFTGRKDSEGYGISLDHAIARLLPHPRFSSLHFGFFTTSRTEEPGQKHTVYSGSNRPVIPNADPRAGFRALFGGTSPDAGAAIDDAHARRRSVLDLVRGDFQDLRASLGASDQRRLDDHAQYLRALEEDVAPSCGGDTPGFDVDPESAPGGEISQAQSRLLALALACDLTNVATMQWSWSVNADLKYTWLEGRMPGIGDKNHHRWTHFPSTGDWSQGLPFFREIEKWYVEQVGFLVGELKRLGAFEGTSILWGTSDSRGPHGADEQGRQDKTYVIISAPGTAFDTGKVVDMEAGGSEQDMTRVLRTVARAYGYEEDSFGDPSKHQALITELGVEL